MNAGVRIPIFGKEKSYDRQFKYKSGGKDIDVRRPIYELILI